MGKQHFTPDRTWKNIMTVLRSKNNSVIVLSCKKHKNGVSPKCTYYNIALLFVCNFIGFIFCTSFHDCAFLIVEMVAPTNFSDKTNSLIATILLALCWLLIALITVLLSFCISKWIPAEAKLYQSENDENTC